MHQIRLQRVYNGVVQQGSRRLLRPTHPLIQSPRIPSPVPTTTSIRSIHSIAARAFNTTSSPPIGLSQTAHGVIRSVASTTSTITSSSSSSAAPPLNWSIGQEVAGGFKVVNKTEVKDFNMIVYELRHSESGALYYHISRADSDMAFSVGFRTPVSNSTGVAHILEHTALCGSARYPVRDPFFLLTRRSLKTFMNAMTAQDYTMYPFSTQNKQDFTNLLEVYLDACFFPLLNKLDFKQEGHRLELVDATAISSDANENAPAAAPSTSSSSAVLQIKGVVYNEMKGAMSDTSQLFMSKLQEELFPTNSNHWNSGGEPSVIPTLTHEELKEFHRRCYNLENAVFISYGDQEPPLQLIQQRVIQPILEQRKSSIAPTQPIVPPPYQPEQRFQQPKVVHAACPPDPLIPDPTKQTKVSISFLCQPFGAAGAPAVSDQEREVENFALQMLSSLLLESATSPLYQSLIDPNIGSGYAPGTGYDNSTREPSFSFGLQGIQHEDIDRVLTIIRTTLEEVSQTGFPSERIEAAIHQIEISLKHVQAHFGIGLLMKMIPAWAHQQTPIGSLKVNELIAQLRKKLAAGPYFQELIQKHLLNNTHSVTLIMEPDVDYSTKEAEIEQSKLQSKLNELTPEDRLQLQQEAAELVAAQNSKQDTKGCQLPSLTIKDIKEKVEPITLTAIPPPPESIFYRIHLCEMSLEVASALNDKAQASRLRVELKRLQSLRLFAFPYDKSGRADRTHALRQYLVQLLRSTIRLKKLQFRRHPTNHTAMIKRHHFILMESVNQTLGRMQAVTDHLSQLGGKKLEEDCLTETPLPEHTANAEMNQQLPADARLIHKLKLVDHSSDAAGSSLPLPTPDPINDLFLLFQDDLLLHYKMDELNELCAQASGDKEALGPLTAIRSLIVRDHHLLVSAIMTAFAEARPILQANPVTLLNCTNRMQEVRTRYGTLVRFLTKKHDPHVSNILNHGVEVCVNILQWCTYKAKETPTTQPNHPIKEAIPTTPTTPTALPRLVRLSQPTNGIGYVRALVSAKRVPIELRPYLPLYTAFLTELGTTKMDYRQLSHALEMSTGGVSAEINVFSQLDDLNKHEEFILFKSLALERNFPQMIRLLHQILYTSQFDHLDRLQQLLLQTAASCANSLQDGGSSYATSDASQYLFSSASANEIYGGIKYVQLINSIVHSLTHGSPEQIKTVLEETAFKLHQISAYLLRDGLERVFIVGDDSSLTQLENQLPNLLTLPPAKMILPTTALTNNLVSEFPFTLAAESQKTFYTLPTQVNNVSMVLPTVPYTDPAAPKLDVMCKILSSIYIHRELREKGGAYGGHCSHSSDGILTFSSYRDPNSLQSLETYKRAADWLRSGDNFSETDVEEALLSIFSSIDAPKPPASKGLGQFLFGITNEQRQLYRDRLLSVKKESVLEVCDQFLSPERLSRAHVTIVGDETAVPNEIKHSTNDDKWRVQSVTLEEEPTN